MIHIHVLYASLAGKQHYISLECNTPITALDAITQSGILNLYSEELNAKKLAVGIFSHKIAHPESHKLQDGDRVEIYRPLLLDPKEVRRTRARLNPVGKRKLRPHEKT